MRNIRAVIESIEEKPPPVRIASYSAPAGMAFLMLAAFVGAEVSVCIEECIRVGESLEDRLLQCMDRCEVNAEQGSSGCEPKCHKKVGFTRRQVQHRQSQCVSECETYPHFTRFAAFVGVTAMLVVTPLLGAYKDACACECCKGLGCSARQALYAISWVFYGFSLLWVLPAVFEQKGQVGGKILFGIFMGISTAAMAASRQFYEASQSKEGYRSHVGEPTRVAGAQGVQMGAMVGTPVNGPSNTELQTQIQQLQQQVRDLVRLQTMQAQAQAQAAATAQAAPAPAPAPAPAAAPTPPPAELL